jgi:hypothetical protein
MACSYLNTGRCFHEGKILFDVAPASLFLYREVSRLLQRHFWTRPERTEQLVLRETAERQVKSHLASAIRQDQPKRQCSSRRQDWI